MRTEARVATHSQVQALATSGAIAPTLEAVVVNGYVLLVPRQKRFVTKSFTGDEVEQFSITCKEYLDDVEKHKKACEAYEKEVLKINSELPSLAQKMCLLEQT